MTDDYISRIDDMLILMRFYRDRIDGKGESEVIEDFQPLTLWGKDDG